MVEIESRGTGGTRPAAERVGQPVVHAAIVEATEPWRALGGEPEDRWRLLVTHEGLACVHLTVPGDAGPALLAATAGRQAARFAAHRAARARLRKRLGSPPARSEIAVSVVVCTHRRRRTLARLLASLRRLDPASAEVIVVDNDPGMESCEAEAAFAGVRYLREPERGLNIARATGVRAAGSDVVAFIDDDCIAPAGWLDTLPEHFGDETVAVVTGPAFPYELATEHQLMREAVASFDKGPRERRFDWTRIWAVHAGQVGAGANMAFRRRTLLEIGDVFPPELDAGTRTRSGGDLYALYKLIAAGHRVVYEPSAYVLHDHAGDEAALHATVDGYGTGLSAFLTRALVVDREPATFAVWRWLPRMWLRSVLDVASGAGDPRGLSVRSRYLLGGFKGSLAWARSVRAVRRLDGGASAIDPPLGDTPEEALRAGSHAAPAVSEARDLPLVSIVQVRLSDAGGSQAELANEAASRATGEVLLFIGEDETPAPDAAELHGRAHAGSQGERFVVGRTIPVADARSLTTLQARLRTEDEQRLARDAAAPTFADMPAGNVSLTRDAFDRLGGFDPRLDLRAALRDLAVRGLRADLELSHEPHALVHRQLPADAAAYHEAAEREGSGDRLLVAKHPEVAASLPVRRRPDRYPRRLMEAGAITMLRLRRARSAAVPVLRALERMRLRRAWLWLAQLVWRGAYENGLGRSGRIAVGRSGSRQRMRVDLAADDPLPPPEAAAPALDLVAGQRLLGRARTPSGHWHHEVFDDALDVWGQEAGRLFPNVPPAVALAAREAGALERSSPAPSERPLAGVDVVCASGEAQERTALEVAGACVFPLPPSHTGERFWRRLPAALAAGSAELVAIALPGVQLRPEAIAAVLSAFESQRTAAVLATGAKADEQASPLLFAYPERHRPRYAQPGLPPQLIVLRRSVGEAALDPDVGRLGVQAPALDLADRVLTQERLVAYAEVPGLTPPAPEAAYSYRAGFARGRARAALVCRDAAELGGAKGIWHFCTHGLLPRARVLWRALIRKEPSLSRWVGGSVAFACGCATAVFKRRAG